MSCLTVQMMLDLKKYGFTFEQFENDSNSGGVFYYNDCEYTIGGRWDEPCSEEDHIIAKNGIWLPNESDLMLWLQWNFNYDVTIKYIDSERYFYAVADDGSRNSFKGSGPDLLCCLYKLVLRICKHNCNKSPS